MASRHALIVKQVQIDWTAQKRGRLFLNPNGYAELEHVRYGLGDGSADLIGFEYVDGYSVFCGVEVKTLAYKKFSKDQIKWLDAMLFLKCRAYIAIERKDRLYEIVEWSVYRDRS